MRPWLVCEVDEARGLAAIRGREAKRTAALLSPVPPRWSAQARGWLVPASVAQDVSAYAFVHRQWALIYNRKERG